MNKNNQIQIDLETKLRQYMPAIFRLLSSHSLNAKQWKKLNAKFIEEYYKREALYKANNNYLLVEANLYDLISSAINGDKPALRLIGYIDVLFKALDNNLLEQEKKLIRDTVYNALINLDHKFRNFIGEMSVLLNAVDGRKYSLLAVEKNIIAGNKTTDFTLLDNTNKNQELVEVVNIHIDNKRYLRETITNKIIDKIADKTKKLETYNAFTLVPVIWAPVEVLQDIASLYKTDDSMKIDGVNEPLAYCVFNAPDDTPVYRFAHISRLFPEGRIVVKWVD